MRISLLGCLVMIYGTLVSCYSYGPIHTPYGNTTKRTLPPPPPKVVAPPLSKSEYLEKTFQELKQNLPEAEVQLVEDSIKVIFPNHITYQNRSVYPDGAYEEPLQRFVTTLKRYRQTNIMISGHTDSRGKDDQNRKISKERASKIKQLLIQQGISAARLETWGLGSISPIADDATEEGRAKNRRVEFVVLYDEK